MRCALVDRPIEIAAIVSEVARNSNGATLLFIGTVRDVNNGRAITGMDYTATARELLHDKGWESYVDWGPLGDALQKKTGVPTRITQGGPLRRPRETVTALGLE